MISDFLPPAITVTNARGGGGKPGEAADHRLCLSEEQICNCCRISPGSEAQTQAPAQHSREICGTRAPWVGAGPYLLSRVNTPLTLAGANYAHCSLEDGNYSLVERPSLAEVHLLHTDYTLHSTLSLSGATKISRYLIRAKWDREEGGGGCGADLEPCVTVLPRVGAGAGYTLPTNQIYLVFSVTREPSREL